jgi:hypothetical protein
MNLLNNTYHYTWEMEEIWTAWSWKCLRYFWKVKKKKKTSYELVVLLYDLDGKYLQTLGAIWFALNNLFFDRLQLGPTNTKIPVGHSIVVCGINLLSINCCDENLIYLHNVFV